MKVKLKCSHIERRILMKIEASFLKLKKRL
ncbi:MAG: DUF3763 domain-containing protein [Gammaproteobacteria bacterium]|nr:DUF3763 domain-containing protein [Gammaproteobacteria bacterium]